ncbi:hypothetical protein S245_013130 [Arachis hypogaea]
MSGGYADMKQKTKDKLLYVQCCSVVVLCVLKLKSGRPEDSALLCISAALFSESLLHCKLIIRHSLIVPFLNPSTQRRYFEGLNARLGKHKVETFRDEIGTLMKSLNFALSNLKYWISGKKAKLPQIALLSSAEIVPEPLGLVLIISSWNFPFGLSLEPLIGAVAAGNTMILKPSELSPACSSILALGLPNHKSKKLMSQLGKTQSQNVSLVFLTYMALKALRITVLSSFVLISQMKSCSNISTSICLRWNKREIQKKGLIGAA